MKRHVIAAAITLAVGIGLLDPYACVQHSLEAAPDRPIPKAEREKLESTARAALTLLPEPRGYTLIEKSTTSEASESAPWNQSRARWAAPGTARAERAYEARRDHPDQPGHGEDLPDLEQRVFLNSALEAPQGLASEGNTPRAFPLRGAAAVEVTLIGGDDETGDSGSEPGRPAEGGRDRDPGQGGRVRMPVTPEAAASAVTILRIVVSDPATERAFKAGAVSGAIRLPAPRPPARAGAVRALVVELYGARRDVEALARRVRVAALRNLLDRP
jgi:hypothetical protein